MKLFGDLKIGDVFVVEGGFVLTKTTETEAEFPDAPNVGKIKHFPDCETFTEEEFNQLFRDKPREVLI